MMSKKTPKMRNRTTVYVATAAAFILFFMYLRLPGGSGSSSSMGPSSYSSSTRQSPVHVSKELLEGSVIMPKLGNETIKAELGRASWKLFHTMLARFPEKPTKDQRDALSSYMHLFSRLYPCGECAAHFQKLLESFPPQTSSREAASQWGCHVHNQVNERLKKEIFDCNSIADKYKCGCAEEDEKDGVKGVAEGSGGSSNSSKTTTVSPDKAGDELIKEPKKKADDDNDSQDQLKNLTRDGFTRGG